MVAKLMDYSIILDGDCSINLLIWAHFVHACDVFTYTIEICTLF